MVEASNLLWNEQRQWRVDDEGNPDMQPQCTATRNVINTGLADAIVIPLISTMGHPNPSICDQLDHGSLQKRLQDAYVRGYNSLPILFFRQTEGMIKLSDCRQMWGDIDCDHGYQKEFVSQEYMFDNGACIHRPPGCREAYYFPPEDSTRQEAGCSAFSESGSKRIELLRALETKKRAMDLTDLTIPCGSSVPTPPTSLRRGIAERVGAPPVPLLNLQITAMVVVVLLIMLTIATRKGARRGPRRRLVMTPPRRVSPTTGISGSLTLDPARQLLVGRKSMSN
jgi:hypothetical protein